MQIHSKMVTSTALFDLIKSLTPSEKRYFKIYAGKHAIGGKNKYEQLFDIIEQQDVYNENEVKKLMRDEKVAGYFAAAKNYLYDMVKDSLHIYHLNLSTESTLRKELHLVSLLYQKGLYGECEKLLRNIKKNATKIDNYLVVYETLLWEARVLRTFKIKLKDSVFVNEIKEQALALAKVKNQDDYAFITSQLGYLFRETPHLEKDSTKKRVEQLYNDPLLKSEKFAITTTSLIFYNYIHQMYNFYVSKNLKLSSEYSRKNIKLFESSIDLIKHAPLNYVRSINNHMQVGLSLKNYHECETIVRGMKSRIEKLKIKLDINSEAKIFVLYALVLTDIYILEKKFEKIYPVINELKEKINSFKGVMNAPDEKMLYFNIAYLYFALGEMKNSLYWLNMLLNMPDTDLQKYVVWSGKLLLIMIRVELQDMELVNYMQKSTYRFLQKKGAIGDAEKIFFSLIKKMISVTEEKKLLLLYKETKAKYIECTANTPEASALKHINFIDWLDSRIEKKFISAIARHK